MPRVQINMDIMSEPTTVSDMRKRLAQVLSKLPGDSEVFFSFQATLLNYKPTKKV